MRTATIAALLLVLGGVGLAGATADDAKRAARSYKLLDVYGTPRVGALAWSPDGERLYTAGTDDLLRIFDAHTLHQLGSFAHKGAWASQVAVSKDGSRVAVGDFQGAVTIHDAQTGAPLVQFGGGGRPVTGLGWSEKGGELGVAWLHGPIRVVDTLNGRPVETMGGPGEWFGRADFNFTAGVVAAGGKGGQVRVWELRGGRTIAELSPGLDTYQVEVELSPGGSRVVAVDTQGTLRLWDVPNQELMLEVEGVYDGGVSFTADGQHLHLPTADGVPRVLDLASGQESGRYVAPPRWTGLPFEIDDEEEAAARGEVRSQRSRILAGADVAVSPDATRLAEAWGDTLRVWDLESGALLASRDTGLAAVTSVAFSPAEGGLLAAADRLGEIRVRAPADDGAQRAMLVLPSGPASRISFSTDGRWLAIAGPDNHVRVWEVLAGSTARTLFGHEAALTDVTFSSADRLASASMDGTLGLWDIETRQRTGVIQADARGTQRVVYSPDGRRLVAWAVRDPEPAQGEPEKPPTESPRIHAASDKGGVLDTPGLTHAGGAGVVSPDGKRLYSSRDNLEWLVFGEGVLEGRGPGRYAEMQFSPDGLLLAGADRDGSVDLLEPYNGQLLLSLSGHTGRVNAVAFSPDGKMIASGSEDGTVRVWSRE
ncbi:MAG: hypothetical protein H6740_20990 [Alphaproteobacteria bacterium]|nr:hypothetical protein [Alphaproteobacteria bacterium]